MVHIRSLVKAGQTSHTVSLPKEWLDKNNLKRGDLIYLHENGEKELLITPHLLKDTPQELKEITISIDKKEIDTIQREITSAYINNYHLINIAGENLSEHLKDIRNIIQDFVALEVVEQTNKRIVVKDLLNLDDIAIDKTIKRMDMVVRSMLQDSKGSVEKPELDESIRFRDEDVNRIYFILFRLLKSALKNPKIAEKFGLSNDKLLSTWYLAVNVENVADCCKNISTLLKKANNAEQVQRTSLTKSLGRKDETELASSTLKELEKSYLDVMKSYYNKDKILADSVAKQRIGLLKQIDKLPQQYSESFKLMTTLLGNVARIVLDEE